jgi:hypothetical protein
VESKSRDELDEFRRRLKEQWGCLWRERFDDRVRAEGISVRDYPLLLMSRGFVVFASRDAKAPNFSEIAGFWASQGCMYSPEPSEGGWGKFIRSEVKTLGKSRAKMFRYSQPKQNGEKAQRKKGGRGWLHVE